MGAVVADSMVSTEVPTLVRLATLVAAFEFNRTVPKLIVVGAEDRVAFSAGAIVAPAVDDGVPPMGPPHAVRSKDRARVSKTGRKTKRPESCLARLFSGEDFISGVRSFFGIMSQLV